MHDAASIPFHLLRPLWLLALIPVAAIFAMLLWRQNPRAQWGGVIAPHLLQHLIVQPGQGRGVNPLYLVTAGLVLGIVALSGPTWRRELPPFVEDKAPLMIVLALSTSMNQADVAPTRLERAKQKIRDLLGARAGARSGLIAYAGTAHLVMPLTDDRSVIEPFLAALSTGLMPEDGKNATAAVSLATQFLAAEPVAGTILVVADGLDEAAIRQAAGRNGVAMLAVAPAPSGGGMGLGSDVVHVSVDSSDIQAIEPKSKPASKRRKAMRSACNGATKAIGCCFRSRCLACSGSGANDGGLGGDVVRRHAGLACKSAGTAAPFCRPVADAGPAGTDCV